MQQARSEMRAHADAGVEEAADRHRMLVSKIAYLRMRVPKRSRDAGKVGVGRFIVRDGQVVEGDGQQSVDKCALLPV